VTTTVAGSRVGALAKVEVRRYATHPVFVAGAVLWAVTTAIGVLSTTDDVYSPPMSAAVFLGLFGVVVGFRLARSLERSAEAVNVVPASLQERVGALLLAAMLPGALGLVSAVVCLTVPDVAGDWVYGTWSEGERVAIVLAMTAGSALGGPLLGVMAARWLRFPGAVVVPVVAVSAWGIVGNGWTANNQNSLGWLMVRLFSPFAFFTTLDTDTGTTHAVESWRGNPWFFLLWVLLLCAFAAVVALLKDADGETAASLRRALVVVVVLALASFALAVAAGPDHASLTSPTGTTRL
jgi:hypothetical protein